MAKVKKDQVLEGNLKDRLLKKFNGKSFLMSQTDIYTITDWFDTGSYMLNVQISGKLRGGMPNIGALMVTGEESTGKSFVVDEIIKSAQKKGYLVKKYETEGSGDRSGMVKKKIDIEELIIEPIATVEELTASLIQTLDEVTYGEKLLIALDSIGNLCSKKELEDSTNNNDKRDMTKQQKLRAMFRTVMIKALLKRIPIVMTNHVYQIIGCVTGDTNIKMANGELKEIQYVSAGDEVETLLGCKPVIDTYNYEFEEIYELLLSDGSTINATGNHKFLTEDLVWKKVEEFEEGEKVVAR